MPTEKDRRENGDGVETDEVHLSQCQSPGAPNCKSSRDIVSRPRSLLRQRGRPGARANEFSKFGCQSTRPLCLHEKGYYGGGSHPYYDLTSTFSLSSGYSPSISFPWGSLNALRDPLSAAVAQTDAFIPLSFDQILYHFDCGVVTR